MVEIEKPVTIPTYIPSAPEVEFTARTQFALFPDKQLDIGSISIAGAIEPARTVTGDWYDFHNTGKGFVVASIGDVTDKGVKAALVQYAVMLQLKQSSSHYSRPDHLCHHLNNFLQDYNIPALVPHTILYIHPQNHKIQLARSGGPLPLVISADGQVQQIPFQTGMEAGMGLFSRQIDTPWAEETEFHTQELILSVGESLVLYTDGLQELFSIDVISAILAQTTQETQDYFTSQQICDLLITQARNKWSQNDMHPPDDITVMAVSCRQ